jgi:hypothetical protein
MREVTLKKGDLEYNVLIVGIFVYYVDCDIEEMQAQFTAMI